MTRDKDHYNGKTVFLCILDIEYIMWADIHHVSQEDD